MEIFTKKMKSFSERVEGPILYLEFDAHYYMKGRFKSYFNEEIDLVLIAKDDLCQKQGTFNFLDAHNKNAEPSEHLRSMDCFNDFILVDKVYYQTKSHPGPWVIFEFKRIK